MYSTIILKANVYLVCSGYGVRLMVVVIFGICQSFAWIVANHSHELLTLAVNHAKNYVRQINAKHPWQRFVCHTEKKYSEFEDVHKENFKYSFAMPQCSKPSDFLLLRSIFEGFGNFDLPICANASEYLNPLFH